MRRNPDIQFASQQEIKAYQESLLAETLQYLQQHSPYYRRMFAEQGIDVADIRHIEDLAGLPVTTKTDLQLHNDDFLCVPRNEVIDYVTTSGTLGTPVNFAPYFMGARELGMGVCRVGNGIPELQWDTIHRIHSTCGMVIPSFLLKLIDFAEKNGIDYHQSSLKKCICIGEALRMYPDYEPNTLGKQIQARWSELKLHSTYASTEMQASFTDCEYFHGGHLQPDLIIVEFLDDDNNPVPDDEPGEVTVTTLQVTGMPLLRFKTGDICYHHSDPCPCGRNTIRLSPVLGRKGQMIKYKGTTLYPPALFDILDNIPAVTNYIVEVYTNNIGTDEILIRVGAPNAGSSLEKEIKDLFRAKVRVAPTVRFEQPELITQLQFPAMSRKPVKFIDLRK